MNFIVLKQVFLKKNRNSRQAGNETKMDKISEGLNPHNMPVPQGGSSKILCKAESFIFTKTSTF